MLSDKKGTAIENEIVTDRHTIRANRSTGTGRPLISVVIPTRDRPDELAQALTSVAQLRTPSVPIEAIVVDDASRDRLEPVAAAFEACLIRSPGTGISAARNAGAAAARGEYILFLDDDDYLLPGVVDALLPLLQNDPSIDGAYGQIQTADAMLEPIHDPYPSIVDVDPFHAFLGRFQQIGTVLCRRSVLEGVGRFDESLPAGEDWDWLLRLAMRHPLRSVLVPCLKFRQRPPGQADRMMLERLPLTRRVFWRNVRAAGSRRPPWPRTLRSYVGNNGRWTRLFLASLHAHLEAGDATAARLALRAALRSSPAHLARCLLREPATRSDVARALRRRRATAQS